MKTLSFASLKGGTGKTTLAAHVAVEAVANGETVALIDLDAQASLAEWFNAREADTPAYARLEDLGGIPDALDKLDKGGYTLAIIDTPATDKIALKAALAASDFALVPVRPSPNDLRAIGATSEEIEGAGIPFAFVLSQRVSRTKISEQATIALGNLGKVTPAVIGARTLYASAMIDGRTAQEIEPKGYAAEEIAELWKFTKGKL